MTYKKTPLTPYAELRHAAQNYAQAALRVGIIKRRVCEICGTHDNAEMHHDDYGKPQEIRWLCKAHHQQWHELNYPKHGGFGLITRKQQPRSA